MNWCHGGTMVHVRSSGCITLLFQLKRLLNVTSVAYRPTDKWHDKRRSWTASKVLEGNGLYKHYLQWLFWRDEKLHEHSRDRRWPGEIRTGLIEKIFRLLAAIGTCCVRAERLRSRSDWLYKDSHVPVKKRSNILYSVWLWMSAYTNNHVQGSGLSRTVTLTYEKTYSMTVNGPWNDCGHTHSENWSLI